MRLSPLKFVNLSCQCFKFIKTDNWFLHVIKLFFKKRENKIILEQILFATENQKSIITVVYTDLNINL